MHGTRVGLQGCRERDMDRGPEIWRNRGREMERQGTEEVEDEHQMQRVYAKCMISIACV
jgi:hypothetical protein